MSFIFFFALFIGFCYNICGSQEDSVLYYRLATRINRRMWYLNYCMYGTPNVQWKINLVGNLVYADDVPHLLDTCTDGMEINPFIVTTWVYLIDFAQVLPVSNSRFALPYLNYITATFLTLFRHFWGNHPPNSSFRIYHSEDDFLVIFRGVFHLEFTSIPAQ